MLGRLLIGGLLLVAVAAIFTIYISGTITKAKLERELAQRNLRVGIIKAVDNCNNVIKLEDLDSDDVYEVHGDAIDYDIDENDYIYA